MVKLTKKLDDHDLQLFLRRCKNISDSGELSYASDSKVFFGGEGEEVVQAFNKWMQQSRERKNWVGISGSWRYINQQVIDDTAQSVRYFSKKGIGIITGGALGVDFIATEIMLKEANPDEQLRVVLPMNREAYMERYTDALFKEAKISRTQAETLTNQILYINSHFPKIIFDQTPFNEKEFLIEENEHYRMLAYNFRNGLVGYGCDGLVALCVNESSGVQDTVRKLLKMKKPHLLLEYAIKKDSPEIITDYSALQIPCLSQDYPLKTKLTNPHYVHRDIPLTFPNSELLH